MRRSANVIVPLIMDFLAPSSVIDVGCATGVWLTTFRAHGISDVIGVDGDYLHPSLLEIPAEQFLAFDLTKPLRLDRQFDLVMSLEVAEHLPWNCADMFVDSLTRLGKAVLFGAAIPYQGGTSHLNEQWPEFWASRFAQRDFVPVDFLRHRVWNHSGVAWWYAQNTLLYAHPDYYSVRPSVLSEVKRTESVPLSVVHPEGYLQAIGWDRRVEAAAADLERLLPAGEHFLWVDQGELPDVVARRPHAIPFPERNGQYDGAPENGAKALRELERTLKQGARFAAFAWPAFWWLDYYAELTAHLRSKCRCVLKNDRLVVFAL